MDTIARRLLLAASLLLAAASAPAREDPSGAWRIQQAVVAPWVDAAMPAAQDAPVGALLRIGDGRVEGPGVLACDNAEVEPTRSTPEGLFQGMLPAPQAGAAEGLGLSAGPVAGVRIRCDSGVFEFHRPEPDVLLLALDNQVLTLSRSAGALADVSAPEGAVQALLERHFAGDMGFAPATLEPLSGWLDPQLRRSAADYFERHAGADEPPPVDGDPFTDSQEYPTRFVVRAAQPADGRAVVPVVFADAHRTRRVDYHLLRAPDGGWRLADLAYPRGERLGEWLAQ